VKEEREATAKERDHWVLRLTISQHQKAKERGKERANHGNGDNKGLQLRLGSRQTLGNHGARNHLASSLRATATFAAGMAIGPETATKAVQSERWRRMSR
jgi:hypothetical protein